MASELVMSGIEHITWVALNGEYETYTVTLGESGEISDVSNRMYVGTLSDDSILTGQGDFAEAYGADGDDVIEILSGSSWASGDAGNDIIYGGAGNDTLHGDFASGFAGNDVIYGNDGDDIISGQAGADQLFGGNGDDEIYGGDGDDYKRLDWQRRVLRAQVTIRSSIQVGKTSLTGVRVLIR